MKTLIIVVGLMLFVSFIYGEGERDKKDLLVSFVLDETGSMMKRRAATISSFNEYLSTLQNRECDEIIITLTKFNSGGIDVIFNETDVNCVPDINNDTYNPEMNTPLYDAIGKAINEVDIEKDINVLFVILTDGLENASYEYTQNMIFELIKDRECKGWTFVFLGADQDSYVAEAIGFQSGNIYLWDSNTTTINVGASSPMQQLIMNTSSFLDSGAVQTDCFFKK